MALTDTFQSFLFLSTPSARRATLMLLMASATIAISIHALREEGDVPLIDDGMGCIRFLSTPSARRATSGLRPGAQDHPISIHALREEGDSRQPARSPSSCNFYPRPPRGGRRARSNFYAPKRNEFLSTPSARRATLHDRRQRERRPISIHALREEGDA